MQEHTRENVIAQAMWASKRLADQFDLLMDAFDFFQQRYPPVTDSDRFRLRDVAVSLEALGSLPRILAMELIAWKTESDQTFSVKGLEIHVLNEIHIHLSAMYKFIKDAGIEMEGFSLLEVDRQLSTLKVANRLIGTSAST